MTRVEIVQKINEILLRDFEVPQEKIRSEATLFGDLALDSLDAVDMLAYLEDQLKMSVDVERFKGVRTVGDVYNLVEGLFAKRNVS